MLRAVFDPNVLISAVIAPEGTSATLLDAWFGGAFDLVVSPLLLAELERVLLRPKFRRYASEEEVGRYLTLFHKLATHASDPELTEKLSPDPGDDYLIALARAVRAHYLVSGDKHLLGLEDARPPVVSPAEFLRMPLAT